MGRLEGKVAFVTGGSRGIGQRIAEGLARAGASVVLTFREREGSADNVVQGIRSEGGHAAAVRLDQSLRVDCQAALAFATRTFGAPLILVNNAARAEEKPFAAITDADFDAMLAANLRGPFALCQEALPAMLAAGWGRIINLASIGGQWGGMNQVHYALSKAGIVCLTRSLAKLYSRHGVLTNAVAPGLVATEMTAFELASSVGLEKARGIPQGRIGDCREIADIVVFLASDESSYVTGQTLNANGGMLMST